MFTMRRAEDCAPIELFPSRIYQPSSPEFTVRELTLATQSDNCHYAREVRRDQTVLPATYHML